MHELSLVDELVTACRERAQGRAVREVSVRCPASLDAAELSEGFGFAARQLASAGDTCLQAAELKLVAAPVHLKCACGYDGQPDGDNFAGHMVICPRCAHVGEADTGLELVNISFFNGPRRPRRREDNSIR
jgi:Zn finger protein HypA/HybF involved in hydrogenase expression